MHAKNTLLYLMLLWVCAQVAFAVEAPSLSVELSIDRTTVVSGEPVPATVLITNIGKNDLMYMRQGSFLTETKITVRSESGMIIQHLETCWVFGTPIISIINARRLSPGQSITGTSNLGRIHDLPPGKYTATAYVNQFAMPEFGILAVKAESKPFSFTVKELKIQAIEQHEEKELTYGLLLCDDELFVGSIYPQLKRPWNLYYLGVTRKKLDGITWGASNKGFIVQIPEAEGKSTFIYQYLDELKIIPAKTVSATPEKP